MKDYVYCMGTEQPRHEEVVESTADTERKMQPQRVPVRRVRERRGPRDSRSLSRGHPE